MIDINFKIIILPSGTERYRLIADTEGELTISKMGQLIFAHEEILLVEFARVLGEWLKINNENINRDFIYNSMDFEEEPVLAFRRQKAGNLLIESALLEMSRNIIIKPDELIEASKIFLQDLHDSLVCKGIKFENYDAFEASYKL